MVVSMAACVALDAHTATREFYNDNTYDMWLAIGAGVICAICFASYLNDIVKMTKDVHNKKS